MPARCAPQPSRYAAPDRDRAASSGPDALRLRRRCALNPPAAATASWRHLTQFAWWTVLLSEQVTVKPRRAPAWGTMRPRADGRSADRRAEQAVDQLRVPVKERPRLQRSGLIRPDRGHPAAGRELRRGDADALGDPSVDVDEHRHGYESSLRPR